MKKIILTLLITIAVALTGCNTQPYERDITNHYRTTQFTADLTPMKDYKPLEFSELYDYEPLNGYYFQIQPNYYVVHTYKCTLRFTALFKSIENYTQVDTVYLHKKSEGIYEVCRRYSLTQR